MKHIYKNSLILSLLFSSFTLTNLVSCNNQETKDDELKEIIPNKKEINLKIGDKEKIELNLNPSNFDLSKLDYSYDKNIINFDINNLTITALKKGFTDLKISKGKVETIIKITVDDILATSISSDFSRKRIGIDEEIKINVTFLPTNVTDKNLKFISSDTSVFVVSQIGLIKGIATGKAILTISYPSNNEISPLIYEIEVTDDDTQVNKDKYLENINKASINEGKDIVGGNLSYIIKRKNDTEKSFTNEFNIFDDHIYNNINDFDDNKYILYHAKDEKSLYTAKNSETESNKEIKTISEDYGAINEETANNMISKVAFFYETYNTKYTYGVGEYLINDIINNQFMNDFNIDSTAISGDENNILFSLNLSNSYQKETLRLKLSLENDNFKNIIFEHKIYEHNKLDNNFNELIGSKPYEYYLFNVDFEIGKRIKEDNPILDFNNFYYQDFDIEFKNNFTGEISDTFYVKDTIVFNLKSFSPLDASSSIDPIKIISSSNENVLRISQNQYALMADNEGESIITLKSKNVTKTYLLKVKYKEPTKVIFKDFRDTITTNEILEFNIDVEPSGAKNDLEISLKEESKKYATLTKNSFNYVLTPIIKDLKEEVILIIEIRSKLYPSLNIDKEIKLIKALTDKEMKEILVNNIYVGTPIYGLNETFNKIEVSFDNDNNGLVNIYRNNTTLVDYFKFKYAVNNGKMSLTNNIYSFEGIFNDLKIILDVKDLSSFKVKFILEDEYEGDYIYEYKCIKKDI